jgi:dihydroorotate dehydrogenase electron transfer subunit
LDRPFSFHRATEKGLSFLIRAVGQASALLTSLAPGASIRLTGPLGRVEPKISQGVGPLILVAGGAGLGPMGMFGGTAFSPKILLYGERTGALQASIDFLAGISEDARPFTDDGTGHGTPGLVTQGLGPALDDFGGRATVVACGPAPMLKAVAKIALDKGASAFISAEAFMACGLGVCLACSVPLREGGRARLCVEGPVLPGDALLL